MKKLFFMYWTVFAAVVGCQSVNASDQLGKLSPVFTKNVGQWDKRVLFRADAGGSTMWFTNEGITYQFTRRVDEIGIDPLTQTDSRLFSNDFQASNIEQLVLTAKFVGANSTPGVFGEGLMEHRCNYFFGSDQTNWHTNVPNYEAFTLKGIYPGIDIRYSSDGNGQVAYEYIDIAGQGMDKIKLEYEGAIERSIDADGKLLLRTKWGDVIAGITMPTNGFQSGTCNLSFESSGSMGFGSGNPIGQSPGAFGLGLIYSTYLGGSSSDVGNDIAVDGIGNVYVIGITFSSDFPTLTPYQDTYRNFGDAFVVKLSSTGSLVFSTYFGGNGDDYGQSLAVDGGNDICLTGYTRSTNFPTLNPFQGTLMGTGFVYQDAFITKLNSSGNSLVFSTYLGGATGAEQAEVIAVDSSGNAYVAGSTVSSDFPTLNPYQPTHHGGSLDAFVSKFSGTGALIYSTYLGGGNADYPIGGIAVDSANNAYVTGETYSSDFPTLNPYQGSIQGAGDVFVTKLSATGNSLVFSTYLGGDAEDTGNDIAVDGGGCAYVVGTTGSSDFPTAVPFQSSLQSGGGFDSFVTKFSSTGNSLVYSTYLGGEGIDGGYSIAVDFNGFAHVVGYTGATNFPTLNSYQSSFQGAGDVVVTKFDSTGSTLVYGTYLGGSNQDSPSGIAIDNFGNAYITGQTYSMNFPTLNPYQLTCQGCMFGNNDCFVTKLKLLEYSCGDADGTSIITISDAVFLIYYIFSSGTAPNPPISGDADCNGIITISDAVYLINYIFSGGPAPCSACL